ncbi:hypothetical protein [Pseudonocardia sp. HH130630-07]|uniref:hypothetical protein n=1 Tax=Pseudonocardia sp. HH130630-07 TaxID=1690815 RepID=UPI000814C88E|nr:hypothetical protein [Pseudonocardia sp. HH130630-07]ANY05037.1 hypothetical protein AFB00_00360 [Pseudonocardia sp. HH130630-07]
MAQHEPQVLLMADVADKWVVRCDCGCGLKEQYAQQEEADERAEQVLAENDVPDEREQAIDEVRAEITDPI